MHKLY
jgi:hypothetical protein